MSRAETTFVGMLMNGHIRLWRDGEPSIWAIRDRQEYDELLNAYTAGDIGAAAFRDGYYRTTVDLDTTSMVGCFHIRKTLGTGARYGVGHFVQLSEPDVDKADHKVWTQPIRHTVEIAIDAASDYAAERGAYLIISGHDVDGPAVTLGRAYREGDNLSIMSAKPAPGTERWLGAIGPDPVKLVARIDPHSRGEIGELARTALEAWGITPWDVVLTVVSPIEQATGSMVPFEKHPAWASGCSTDT